MSRDLLNVAVWSVGQHARKNILPALAECDRTNLYGVCSRDSKKVVGLVEEFNCIGWCDPVEMLKDDNIDVIYSAAPIALHFHHAVAALSANKHFWCEKPFTSSFNDTEKIISIAKSKGLCVAEAFMSFYHPQFLKLKEIVKSQTLGNIISVSCKFGIPSLEQPGFRKFRELGGGAFWDVGSYTSSIILEIFDTQEPQVLLSTKFFDDEMLDCKGFASLLFGKSIANIEWATGVSYKNDISLWGDKGALYTDRIFSKKQNFSPNIFISSKNGEQTIINVPCENHFVTMLDYFARLVDDERESELEMNKIRNRSKLLDSIDRNSIKYF